MGFHNNHQIFHRRVAALKQRRLSPDEEATKLKELIARFSPTFVWTATLTDSIPLPTLPADAVPTTSASDNQDGDTGGNTPVTTSPTPTPAPMPAPATTPTVPATTSTTVASTNTPVAPNPPVQTTNAAPNAAPTTSTSTVVVVAHPATTPAPPAAVTTPDTTPSITTPGTVPSVVQITSSRTISSAAASATETQSSGSGTNVGGIVGGLVGGLIGVAAVIFVIRFLLNRQRKRNDEMSAAAFSPTDFRRSAILMEDPPTHDEIVERGFNPRPPTMIERRLASPAPTFGAQYGAPVPVMGPTDYGYNQYQAYGPMQTMSPHSATVMLNNSPYPNPAYTQSPFAPLSTPTSATQFEEGQQAAVLTRQSSNGSPRSSGYGPAGYPSEDPNHGGYTGPKQSEYVDLDRSSVTPLQAAQYSENSQKFSAEAHSGLNTPAVNEALQNTNANEAAPSLPAKDNGPSPSPFSDPIDPVTGHLPYPGEVSPRPSSDSVSRQIDDFPVPPSPVHSSLSRVDSIPPMLPEIPVGSRPSSYNFPVPDRANGAAKEYSKSPLGNQSPAAPSPLASGITVSAPLPAATSFPDAAPPTPRQNKFDASVKRPDTVYDDNDAYGGI